MKDWPISFYPPSPCLCSSVARAGIISIWACRPHSLSKHTLTLPLAADAERLGGMAVLLAWWRWWLGMYAPSRIAQPKPGTCRELRKRQIRGYGPWGGYSTPRWEYCGRPTAPDSNYCQSCIWKQRNLAG